MDYVEIVGKDYEDALAKARNELGPDFGVLSKKYVSQNSFIGIGKSKKCVLTCFLVEKREEKPEQSEQPEQLKTDAQVSEIETVTEEEPAVMKEPAVIEESKSDTLQPDKIQYFLDYAKGILLVNDFTQSFIDKVLHNLEMQLSSSSLTSVPTEKEIEVSLIDLIFSSFSIDRHTQIESPKFFSVVGVTDSGKTSVITKIASLFSNKTVAVISLDNSVKTKSLHEKAAKALGYCFYCAGNTDSLSSAIDSTVDCDIVFVDTAGFPIKSTQSDFETQSRLNTFAEKDSAVFLVLPAYMKESDFKAVFELYSNFSFNGIIVTKVDDTTTIGPLLSVLSDQNKPVVYISDGKKIPSNIHVASTTYFLSCLKGFTLDLSKITG